MDVSLLGLIAAALVLIFFLYVAIRSFVNIGAAEQGLVTKRFGKSLPTGQLIATDGQAGYQMETLRPGLRFKLWPLFYVERMPLVQIPAGSIGLVIAQVGAPLDPTARTAVYKREFGNFEDVGEFLRGGGQMGIQRHVLAQGTTVRIHPVAYIVLTTDRQFGRLLSEETEHAMQQAANLPLYMVVNRPDTSTDMVLIVTALEGGADNAGDMAKRIGGFDDIRALEESTQPGQAANATIIEAILASKNDLHGDFQDAQGFLDHGGLVGLQHDVLRYGSWALNPAVFSVQQAPMFVVNQGEVAVVKAYVGLPTVDTSGAEFKFGSIVRPGHRGIWEESLRTGKYALNTRAYSFEIVPTSILTLNWGERNSEAHDLDSRLNAIHAKSRDGFDFSIDLQVQIHVSDVNAPRVISMVGSMSNLVNEVLQSAVGNYFRNALQAMTAMEFIQERSRVQEEAQIYVEAYLNRYNVETRGVYIQDVVFPDELVRVLTQREIAQQEKATYVQQREAELARVDLENVRGTAAAQSELAQARVSIDVNAALAEAAIKEAEGRAGVTTRVAEAEATRITVEGRARADAEQALGLAKATGYDAQTNAIGAEQTAFVAGLEAIANGRVDITPDIVVGSSGTILDALGAVLLRSMNGNGHRQDVPPPPALPAPAAD